MVKGMGGTRPVGGFLAKSDVWQHCFILNMSNVNVIIN